MGILGYAESMNPNRLKDIKVAEDRRISQITYHPRGEPTFLPVFLTGGIGDVILSRTTLDFLGSQGLPVLIYTHHFDAAQYFYPHLPVRRGDIPDLTWCLHVDSVAKFKLSDRFGGFIIPEHKALFDQQQAWFKAHPLLGHLVLQHSQSKFMLTDLVTAQGVTAETMPLISLGYKGVRPLHPFPRKEPKDYITVHDGYDVNNMHAVKDRSTKQWRMEHWNRVMEMIKADYPQYEIIQLGTKTARPIAGVDKNWTNQTTIKEAFDILAHSRLHIDTDSGLVHAATAMSVPCVVLFGPTPISFYGHPENINLQATASCPGNCFHVTQNWMDRCPVDYPTPQCMDDITPERVMSAVRAVLE